ncbi:MAG: hypothetical protein Q4C72_02775 [Eubacteriales bacterium]|nr:hypothetical protein [Eubacteriales bacterium]
MSGAGRSVKNTAKNVSLLVLVALLGLLCAANWLTGLNIAQMPGDSPLRQAHDRLFGGAVGYELRSSGVAAAEPAQLALSADGQLYGVQYNLTEIDAGLETVRGLWAEALSGGVLAEAAEDELNAALRAGDCAVLRYHGAIPLGVIANWMGGAWQSELAAETLVYAAGAEQLFVRTETGAVYAAPVKVSQGTLEAAQKSFRGLTCKFAGGAYAVFPETLLFDSETLSLPLLTAEAPALLDPQSGTGLETLLGAFKYTPYARPYSESGGQVRVYVDDVSTLRIGASGLIQYAAAGSDSTVRAYDEGEASGSAALDAQLDCARLILDAALRAAETDTHASLYAVQQDGDRTTLVFLQMYGGVPILGDSDFATFVFRDGALSSATIRLQRFRAGEIKRTVLPARQAAAGADGTKRDLMVAYRAEENRYVPGRFYL